VKQFGKPVWRFGWQQFARCRCRQHPVRERCKEHAQIRFALSRCTDLRDSSKADDATYDDPVVRAAAVSALGRYNGAVVAVDPHTGRILTVVNQKIASATVTFRARRSSRRSRLQPWKKTSLRATPC